MRACVRYGATFTIIIILVAWVTATDATTSKKKSGPYVTRMMKSQPCEKPSLPYDENPGVLFHDELYTSGNKQNMIRGNVTISRENKNAVMRLKCYTWEDSKWKLIYLFNNAGCKSVWLGSIIGVFGLKYENCEIAKGVYSFQNVDINKIEHMWATTREYSRMMWRFEVFHRGKTWICVEAETEVIPA